MTFRYVALQIIAWTADFFRHWYVDSFQAFVKIFMRLLTYLDRVFALRVSARNLFKPMYQDRSFIGYSFGFIFRAIRIVLALILYAALGAIFTVAYAIWAIVPAYLIIKAVNINVLSIL
ncbi:MAG: hypothetical protein WC519_00870 [Parcubacteria group bacterium]